MFPKVATNSSRMRLGLGSKMKSRTFQIRLSLVLGVLASFLSAGILFAEQFGGSVSVTDKTGTANDSFKYLNAGDAYLISDPNGRNDPGLPAGTYYFQVTDATGKTLLSTDNAECRQLTIDKNGRFTGAAGTASCRHGVGTPAQQSTPIQLAPFSPASNNNGSYTAWLIRQTSTTSVSKSDPRVINFRDTDAKTDNFTVLAGQFLGAVSVINKAGNSKGDDSFGQARNTYLIGGPTDKNDPGLPPGTYYFQVTDSSGKTLLSTDIASCRQVTVGQNGKFAGAAGDASCRHANGTAILQSTPVQLSPFLETPNDDNNYVAWFIRKTPSTSVSTTDPRAINFNKNDSKNDHFKVKRMPVVPVGSCQPSNAMSVLAVGKQVFSFVPKSSDTLPGMASPTGVGVVDVEPEAVPVTHLNTPKGVNSCASNSLTGQTTCTSTDNDVYVFTGPFLAPPLQSSASGTSLFFGGSCMNCGVTMDALHNEALIGLSLAPTSGFQYLNLGLKPSLDPAFHSEAPTALDPGGEISKGILIDPIRNWILSPNESGNYELITVRRARDKNRDKDNDHNGDKDNRDKDNGHNGDKDDRNGSNGDDRHDRTNRAFYEKNSDTDPNFLDPQFGFPPALGSAGEDCRTGIALATLEFSNPSEVYIADLSRVQLSPGSPGTWQAPSQFQELSGSSFPTGPSGTAVAQGTTTGVLIGINSDGITAIQFPPISGPGTTPQITDWMTCRLPNITGAAPHTVNAYQSPSTGHAMAIVGNLDASTVWRVDLTQMMNLPHTRQAHVCDSAFLPPNIVRTIAVP